MNKILILLFAFSCSLSMNAQKKKKSDFEEAIKEYNEEILKLEEKYENLKASNARISKRRFVTENPEQSLRNRLSSYENIQEMAEGDIFSKKPEYQNLPFANSYISLIKMYNSLKTGGYKQEENEAFKNELDTIKVHILSMDPKHEDSFIQSFDDLDNLIRNYRFAMFELARLFELVKEKEGEIEQAGIYKSLCDDGETDFVNKIPYTRAVLINYINGEAPIRAKIVGELRNSCQEAFKDFK